MAKKEVKSLVKHTATGMYIVDMLDLIKPDSLINVEHSPARIEWDNPVCVIVNGAAMKYWDRTAVQTGIVPATDMRPEDMIIFKAQAYGKPWVRTDAKLWSKIWSVTNTDGTAGTTPSAVPAEMALADVVFPNYDYKAMQ